VRISRGANANGFRTLLRHRRARETISQPSGLRLDVARERLQRVAAGRAHGGAIAQRRIRLLERRAAGGREPRNQQRAAA